MIESIKIEIIRSPENGLQVWVDGKTTGQLCLGEMIEQVFALLHPDTCRAYPMATPEEWAQRWARVRARASDSRQRLVKGGA